MFTFLIKCSHFYFFIKQLLIQIKYIPIYLIPSPIKKGNFNETYYYRYLDFFFLLV